MVDPIPPDPYDSIGVPRGSEQHEVMPAQSKNRIRAWALWVIAAIIFVIMAVVAVQLLPIA